MRLAPATHRVEQRGGAEHGGRAEGIHSLDHIRRIDLRRTRCVHVRDDRGHAKRGVEEGKEREGGDIDLALLNAEHLADGDHLGIEVPMTADGTLRRSRGAAREEDGGNLVAARLRHRLGAPSRDDLVQTHATPAEATTDGDKVGQRLAPPAEHEAGCVRLRDADEGRRLGAGDAALDVLEPNARVDEHRNNPSLEERKGERKEVESGLYHEGGAVAPFEPHREQPGGDLVAALVELRVGQPRIAVAVAWVSARSAVDGDVVRAARGHRGEVARDVDRAHGVARPVTGALRRRNSTTFGRSSSPAASST